MQHIPKGRAVIIPLATGSNHRIVNIQITGSRNSNNGLRMLLVILFPLLSRSAALYNKHRGNDQCDHTQHHQQADYFFAFFLSFPLLAQSTLLLQLVCIHLFRLLYIVFLNYTLFFSISQVLTFTYVKIYCKIFKKKGCEAMADVVGRFAPTPSGRMHLGNVFAALIAWLSVRSRGGSMVLRMEDLDTQRTSAEYAQILRGDLLWLGLTWDTETQPQSQRSAVYDRYFDILEQKQLLFPCYCTRSQLHSVNAPHLSDGTYVYPGTCRNLTEAEKAAFGRAPAWRVKVPDHEWTVEDLVQGTYKENLLTDCGDFVVRRADGTYVYQLAVTVDDGLAGVTEVVRGTDLLSSAPRQMYLQELFGFKHPEYGHVPLLLAPDGRRLSKRDKDLDLGVLRTRMAAETLIGSLACTAGLLPEAIPISAAELASEFSWKKLKKESIYLSAEHF